MHPLGVRTRNRLGAARLSAVGLALSIAISASGCSGGHPRARTAVPSPTSLAARSEPTTTTVNVNATAASCSSAQLEITARSGQGATGNWAFPIIFRNVSHNACSLYGYPGVSWITASGAVIGVPARQVQDPASPASTVNLSSGQSAYSVVEVPTVANQESLGCRSIQAAGIRVYAPGSTSAILITPSPDGPDPNSLLYCNIAAGSGGISPVTISSLS